MIFSRFVLNLLNYKHFVPEKNANYPTLFGMLPLRCHSLAIASDSNGD
jgi:hypothetical protein